MTVETASVNADVRVRTAVAATALLCLGVSAMGAVYTWKGPEGDSWSKAGNWDPAIVPLDGYGTIGSSDRVIVNSGWSVAGYSLGVDGALEISQIGTGVTVNGTATIGARAPGSLAIAGGASLGSRAGSIGSNGASSSSVTIADPGSMWNVSQSIRAYDDGQSLGAASINVLNHGGISTGSITLYGPSSGSYVTTLVSDGSGSLIQTKSTQGLSLVLYRRAQAEARNGGAIVVAQSAAVSSGARLVASTGSVTVGSGAQETTPGAVCIWSGGELMNSGGIVEGDVLNSGLYTPSFNHTSDTLGEVQGDYRQGETGGLSISSDLYDVFPTLSVTGEAELAGTLSLHLPYSSGDTNYYPRTLGESHVIVSAASITGQFSEFVGQQIDDQLRWRVEYSPTTVTIVAEAVPEPAIGATIVAVMSSLMLRRRR